MIWLHQNCKNSIIFEKLHNYTNFSTVRLNDTCQYFTLTLNPQLPMKKMLWRKQRFFGGKQSKRIMIKSPGRKYFRNFNIWKYSKSFTTKWILLALCRSLCKYLASVARYKIKTAPNVLALATEANLYYLSP